MNIYKVTRIDGWGYDEYSSFVCYARDEEEAKNLNPFGLDVYRYNFQEATFINWGTLPINYIGWTTTKDNLEVIQLGYSELEMPVGIILASFHAG